MKKLSKIGKDNIEKIKNLSGENEERIHNVLEALMELVAQDYSENERIEIPYFGSLFIRYKGDILTKKGNKEAELEIFFAPSDYLKYIIGKVEDYKKNKLLFTSIPIVEEKLDKISVNIKTKLSDSYQEVKEIV